MPPIYDYCCTNCQAQIELMRKIDGRDDVQCLQCGAAARRLVSAAAFKFRGRVVQGGGPDRFTADMMGIPLKELPEGLKS